MIGLDANDRQINTFILTLRELPGIGSRTTQRILEKHKCEIEKSHILDEMFARNLDESVINKALFFCSKISTYLKMMHELLGLETLTMTSLLIICQA